MSNETAATFDLTGLDPDLHQYVCDGHFGPMLDHPLHREIALQARIGCPALNSVPAGLLGVTHIVRFKEAARDQARADRNWADFIFLHHRPYRVDALSVAIAAVGLNNLWPLVGEVWTDTESVRASFDAWYGLWGAADRGRNPRSLSVMHAEDRKLFLGLRKTVEVWRGCNNLEAVDGFSWTLNREKAVWFANRFADARNPPILARMTVCKSRVRAYFNGRNEQEVVLLPRTGADDAAHWEYLPVAHREAA